MSMQYKVLNVTAENGYYRVERYPVGQVVGPVDVGMALSDHTGGVTIGAGLLAGSIIPGSNRLVVCGRSPAWGGFSVSTMGGAALIFENLGLDAVHVSGRHAVPAVLVLNREHGEEVRVRIEPVPLAEVWRGHGGHVGFHALSHWIWERYSSEYREVPRVLATGPASLATEFGAIGSLVSRHDGLRHVEDWAGRGGFGSKLLRDHNLCAVVYGGTFVDEDFRDRNVADTWFEKRYSTRMKVKDLEATTKYRYDPSIETGGTFGVNYAKMGGRLLAFNYRTVSWDEPARLELHQRLVRDHYLRQFNEETIRAGQSKTCGEPCGAVCKKMRAEFKKDYEPYQTLGPQIGVFDQRAAERAVRCADALGFDGIQVGGVVAWLFECLDLGLLTPEELGVPGTPKFDASGFDPVADSARNADIAVALMEGIVARHGPLDLLDGARARARALTRERGDRGFVDALVVTCFGNRGWMVPNQYWTPGMFSPMAIMGRYYEHYGAEFLPPLQLGDLNADRMVKELMIDNSGVCRFHRLWAEDLLPQMFREIFGEGIDLEEHHRRLARAISRRNMAVPWEGRRVVELITGFLKRAKEVDGVRDPDLDAWLDRFEREPDRAALDYWYEVHKGVTLALVRE
jgi:glyceraldehyde-3-phosphate dehydrogenase (ferredoxin)